MAQLTVQKLARVISQRQNKLNYNHIHVPYVWDPSSVLS